MPRLAVKVARMDRPRAKETGPYTKDLERRVKMKLAASAAVPVSGGMA